MLAIVVGAGFPRGAEAGIGTWTSAGPEGGFINALAVDNTSGVVYAGTRSAGGFQSATFGSVWTPIKDLAGLDVRTLALDSKTIPVTAYAGTNLHGVFKSVDGKRWEASNTGLSNLAVLALAVDPQSPGVVYAGTFGGGAFKSIDSGATWSASSSGIGGGTGNTFVIVQALAIDPMSSTTLYAGTQSAGIFKSTDGGRNWNPSSSGLTDLDIRSLAVDPQRPTTLYAGTFSHGVFKSTNGGLSWSPSDIANNSVLAIAIDSQHSGTVYAGTITGVFKTIDGGATWNQSNSGLTDTQVSALSIDPRRLDIVYAGTLGAGVFESEDAAAHWRSNNVSLLASEIATVTVDPRTPTTLYAGTFGGFYKSTTGGASWSLSNVGLPEGFPDAVISAVAIDPHMPSTIYAVASGFFSHPIFRSETGGASWTPGDAGIIGRVVALAIDPRQSATIYAAGDSVFKSTDGAANWLPSSTGLPVLTLFSALAIDPQTPSTVYVAAALSPGGIAVFKSVDAGANWSRTSVGLQSSFGENIVALIVDPQTPTTLYVAADASGVSKTTDGGATWNPSNSGLPVLPNGCCLRSLAIVLQAAAILYAGTDSGLFKSIDGGATWSLFNPGLPIPLGTIAANPAGTCLHGGSKAGVFDFATEANAECPPLPLLVSAVLPASRSVLVGTRATAFATILNTGAATITTVSGNPSETRTTGTAVTGFRCGITQITGVPTPFSFQATDPVTNRVTGSPNMPTDIPPGGGQTFLMSFDTPIPFFGRDVHFGFNCTNTDQAPTIVGVNTLQLTVSATPVPDIIALVATASNDGIVNVPGATGTGAFSVATTNAGADGVVIVSADTGDATLPMGLVLCQTNPVTGQCRSALAPTVTLTINANDTPTFSVFAVGAGSVPFDPANNRIFVRFKDVAGVIRGATSVAVRTH